MPLPHACVCACLNALEKPNWGFLFCFVFVFGKHNYGSQARGADAAHQRTLCPSLCLKKYLPSLSLSLSLHPTNAALGPSHPPFDILSTHHAHHRPRPPHPALFFRVTPPRARVLVCLLCAFVFWSVNTTMGCWFHKTIKARSKDKAIATTLSNRITPPSQRKVERKAGRVWRRGPAPCAG